MSSCLVSDLRVTPTSYVHTQYKDIMNLYLFRRMEEKLGWGFHFHYPDSLCFSISSTVWDWDRICVRLLLITGVSVSLTSDWSPAKHLTAGHPELDTNTSHIKGRHSFWKLFEQFDEILSVYSSSDHLSLTLTRQMRASDWWSLRRVLRTT